jgi:hypothetical protein
VNAHYLVDIAVPRDGAIFFPYRFNLGSPPDVMQAPWYSAIAQGAALSLFTRLFKLTKDPAWSRAADRTFESFRTPRNETQPWTAFVDRGRLWFEEYPSQEPEQVLNGHLFALFGVYDYARATKKRAAQDVFDGGATTVRDEVGRFRVPGGSSYYNLRDLGGTLKYHDIVVGQLQLLARMTGDRFFAHEAALFHRDAH